MLFLTETPLSLFDKTVQMFERYVDFMICVICHRCGRCMEGLRSDVDQYSHHCGRFWNHIKGVASDQEILLWENNLEHGLFHGLCTALVASLYIDDEIELARKALARVVNTCWKSYNPLPAYLPSNRHPEHSTDFQSKYTDQPLSYEGLFASCLLYDFPACVNRNEELLRLFPHLLPEAYSSSSDSHPLNIALDLEKIPERKVLLGNKVKMLDCFYNSIRPALKEMFQYRHSLWMRHGPEHYHRFEYGTYPQHHRPYYAVEVHRLPLEGCYSHDYNNTKAPWSEIKGIISIERFRELGGELLLHAVYHRDHPFIQIKSKFEDWVFVLEHEVDADASWVKDFKTELLVRKNKVIKRDLANKFLKLCNMVVDRVRIANYHLEEQKDYTTVI